MRIISGEYRGRRLRVPPRDVRPTTDRVRESMFGRLDCDDKRVLDLFAGSGALGLEALSRGARTAVFVERSAPVRSVLRANLDTVLGDGLDAVARIVASNAQAFTRRDAPPEAPFDLVFLDPPYEGRDLAQVLPALARPAWLAVDAMVVVESPKRHAVPLPPGLRLIDERDHGDTRVTRAEPSGEASDRPMEVAGPGNPSEHDNPDAGERRRADR